jgi:hypothetical protein
MSSQEMLNSLAWHDEVEDYGGEDTDEEQEMSETERPRRSIEGGLQSRLYL